MTCIAVHGMQWKEHEMAAFTCRVSTDGSVAHARLAPPLKSDLSYNYGVHFFYFTKTEHAPASLKIFQHGIYWTCKASIHTYDSQRPYLKVTGPVAVWLGETATLF